MIKLIAKLQDGRIKEQEFPEDTVRIGRGVKADFIIPDRRASKLHAEVKAREGNYILTDLGSSNGTLLNDELVTEPTEIHEGDIIGVGHAQVYLESNQRAPEPSEEGDTVNEFMREDAEAGTVMEITDEAGPDGGMITHELATAPVEEVSPGAGRAGESPEVLKFSYEQHGTPETQPMPPTRKVSELLFSQRPKTPRVRGSSVAETVDTAPPSADYEHEVTPAEQYLVERIIQALRSAIEPDSLTVGFVDPETRLPVAPLIVASDDTAVPQPPRLELLRKSIDSRQGILAEVALGSGKKITAFCIPLIGPSGPIGFAYATKEPLQEAAASGVLRDAMAQVAGLAELLDVAQQIPEPSATPGRTQGVPDSALGVAGHIRWHVSEVKRSLFMMASGANQNNMAHVTVGLDRLRRIQYFYESLAQTLEFLNNSEDDYPVRICDLRQVARVTVNVTTEIAADHFITLSSRLAEMALPVRINRELLEAVLSGLTIFGTMNAKEGDEITIEAISPDEGETAWFQLSLPLKAVARNERFGRDLHLNALQKLARLWNGALESAPDADTNMYLLRISFPCVDE